MCKTCQTEQTDNEVIEQMLELVNREKFEAILEHREVLNQTINSEPLLEQWAKNKKEIFRFFGNKLTLEKKEKVTLDEEEIKGVVNDFLYDYNSVLGSIEITNPNIRNFDIYTIRGVISYFIGRFPQAFTTNKLELTESQIKHLKPYFTHISNGMKLSKFFSKCVENTEDRTKFDKVFSQLIQKLQASKEITLYMSINPIDYLTMSIGSFRSCHAIHDGEFKAGTLAYMTDKHTVIHYTLSQQNPIEDDILDGIELPNKVWRMVSYLDIEHKQYFLSRHYPNPSLAHNIMIKNYYAKLFKQYFPEIPVRGVNKLVNWTVSKDRREMSDFLRSKNNLFYLDIHNVSRDYYEHIVIDTGEKVTITIGNYPLCPVCGDSTVTNHEELLCNNCSHTAFCEVCGDWLDDDEIFEYEGETYCRDCYNDRFAECSHCGRVHESDDLSVIDGEWVCDRCRDNYYTWCDNCEEFYPNDECHYIEDISLCDSCYEDRIRREEEEEEEEEAEEIEV